MIKTEICYELFMRSVYKCGRNRKKGADAGIYRAMLKARNRDREDVSEESMIVYLYLQDAFNKLEKDYKHDNELMEKVEECNSILEYPTVKNIEKCIVIIRQATAQKLKQY